MPDDVRIGLPSAKPSEAPKPTEASKPTEVSKPTEAADAPPPRVASLSQLDDYEIADGYPEIRGWEVRDSANRAIGKVHDLLVDVGELRVRYLDVELQQKFAPTEADRRVLIPVEKVDIDGTGDHVLLPDVGVSDVRQLVPHARRGVATSVEQTANP